MRHFVYKGNPEDTRDSRGGINAYGIEFPLNVPVPVTDDKIAAKLSGNSHFQEIQEQAEQE
jgi:hypothetical protein